MFAHLVLLIVTFWKILKDLTHLKKNKMDVQKSEIRIDLKVCSQEATLVVTLDFSRDIPSGGGAGEGPIIRRPHSFEQVGTFRRVRLRVRDFLSSKCARENQPSSFYYEF